MRISELFTKTLREAPKDEESINAKLLIRGGFIFKNSAGVYTFLPLGWRVIEKITRIIREEINAIGGQELFMPALVEKKYMDRTGRWNLGVGFRVKDIDGPEAYVLGWTHEEVLTDVVSKYISSYKDLPFYAYQIQTKFRSEGRAKSGLLRGHEFLMKDLYSFHESESDLFRYYEEVKKTYFKIFEQCDLKTIYTLAGGGAFTISNTNEFQVLADIGEDTIFVCSECGYAENSEISKLKDGNKCPKCSGKIQEKKSIEVGNIFPLGTKYSEAFSLKYIDKNGDKKHVVMGSYGIGISRLIGTIVEINNDENGIIWPENVAPFKVHLVLLDGKKKESDKIYDDLEKAEIEVLYDDREDQSTGEKFADADLIGSPLRVVVSEKTLEKDSVEIKKRNESKTQLVKLNKIIDYVG